MREPRVKENPDGTRHPLDFVLFGPAPMEKGISEIAEATDGWLDEAGVEPNEFLSGGTLACRQIEIDEWWGEIWQTYR